MVTNFELMTLADKLVCEGYILESRFKIIYSKYKDGEFKAKSANLITKIIKEGLDIFTLIDGLIQDRQF